MECISPIYLSKQDITVPCGKCAFCGATKRSDWALRLHYECKMHVSKRFITLTYANPHLHWYKGKSQLVKRHLQEWFKKIRKAGYKCRYFAVGEYGSKTFRPHYHVLFFGDVPEKVLRSKWDKGHIDIGDVTPQSVMYCLSYMINSKSWKMRREREVPFTTMSRGRGVLKGIGSNYLTPEMIQWHKSGRKNYALLHGEKRHLPRYYKQKIFSKIDLVRIAVRDQKEAYNKMVKWLRSPAVRKMADPLGERRKTMLRLHAEMLGKCKDNLKI